MLDRVRVAAPLAPRAGEMGEFPTEVPHGADPPAGLLACFSKREVS